MAKKEEEKKEHEHDWILVTKFTTESGRHRIYRCQICKEVKAEFDAS